MKKTILLIFVAISLVASDYKSMSTEKLINLRGNIPVEDIEVFGNELTSRIQNMSKEEFEKYKGNKNGQNGHTCNALQQRPQR